MKINTQVVFDSDLKIAGLFFKPYIPPQSYGMPEYADTLAFRETEIVLGEEPWSLPGTLSLPLDSRKPPVVILVHGSGPHDRDETIGPNKPFKDLAAGLSSNGIATLRYEKRTKHYATKMSEMRKEVTVVDEVLTDVYAAISFLQVHEEIDSERIYVLGHSLGGMLLPRIATDRPGIAGVIALGAPARPLEDLILDQTRYLLSRDGSLTAAEKENLALLERQVSRVKADDLTADAAGEELPLGVPGAYWLDLKKYDQVKIATKLTLPLLFLQGGRDYQITMQDFELWQETLSGHPNAQLIVLHDLNHLFISGEGNSTPEEYEYAGNVDARVIEIICSWISDN
jgi:dienelactone hydrolase